MKDSFTVTGKVLARADSRMINETVKKLWKGFSLTAGELDLLPGESLTFALGEERAPVLPCGKEYAFSISEKGASVIGKDFGGLMRGYLSLLMKMEYDGKDFFLPFGAEESQYTVKNRMLHLCIFPDDDRYFIKKMVRLAGVCQYTHVVLEFWGTLQYDCMKELSWPGAYTKREAAELIREVRELGMEPVPMFNQLGHAPACRLRHGKHVVLDQNPLLQHLFTPDGWDWRIDSEEVLSLHRAIRQELYELFGEGEFIHVGCDESYNYTHSDELRRALPGFLSHLTDTVVSEGRRPMVWMDMMLERNRYPGATATCHPDEVELMQRSLNPATVMVDWQYRIHEAPVETTLSLAGKGYDVMGAPWYVATNYKALVDTVAENELFGVMMTTWHTLCEKTPSILGCAKKMGVITFPWSPVSSAKTPSKETAAILRRISFEGNDYLSAGWVAHDRPDYYTVN